MSILVTGGAGFIGSRLAAELVARGERVVVADNLVASRSLAPLGDVLDAIEFVHLDVRCPEDFGRLPRGPFDRIFHLAASFANELSVEQPELDRRTNVEGTRNVVRFAERAGCGLLVYTGSSSSYGDAPLPHAEDGSMCPATPYASTKLEAEALVRAAEIPFAIFRLFNVYGPGDLPGRYRNAIPNMAAALARSGRLRIFGEGATRDFTYVDDAVRVLADPAPAIGNVVNVASGVETDVLAVARQLLSLFDLPQDRIDLLPRRPWDNVVRRRAAVERLRTLYGSVPSTPLAEGLRLTLRWLEGAGHLSRRDQG